MAVTDEQQRTLVTAADSDLQYVLGEAGLDLDSQCKVVSLHTTLQNFQACADTRAEARESAHRDFGIAKDTLEGRAQIAALVAGWELAKDVIQKETETRAAAKALDQPRVLHDSRRLQCVWGSQRGGDSFCRILCAQSRRARSQRTITSKKASSTSSLQPTLDASGRLRITQTKVRAELPATRGVSQDHEG